ncbi:MAG: hypothetical protein K2M76_02580, partial [Muribaculaceae bacterium]|nr:hypothetical protein [Muribaculaceae bacterium]
DITHPDNIDLLLYENMETKIEKLTSIFSTMVNNANQRGAMWRNADLAPKALDLMKELPDVMEGEIESPAHKAELLSMMLDQMDETLTPRLCIKVREYMLELNPNDSDNKDQLNMLRDFIDLSMPMENFCKKHNRHLKFDPIERTEEWERVIVDVEKRCNDKLKDEPRCMGFFFMYWSVRRDELARHGISWKSPRAMNPRIRFD